MAARGEFQRAQHEVLGAIVYAASLHVLWKQPAVGLAPPPNVWLYDNAIPESAQFWQGGEMPVKLGDRVKLWLRSGEIGVSNASTVSWSHSGAPDDILAFELVDAA